MRILKYQIIFDAMHHYEKRLSCLLKKSTVKLTGNIPSPEIHPRRLAVQ